MAFQTTVSIETIRKTIWMIIALPLVASSNVDCGGKAFHCVNSTHFMICVDLGGDVSSTIDNFIIPCPPSTQCQETNHFECEFPRSTTVLDTTETIVPSELKLSEITTVTKTNNISTTYDGSFSEVQSTDVNLNTVSITTLQEDSITTSKPVTELGAVENIVTDQYTNIGFTLTATPGDFTTNINTIDTMTSTLTTSDIGFSVTEASTSLYQDTAAMTTIDTVSVTTDFNVSENKSLPDYSTATIIIKTVPDRSTTEMFIGKDTLDSFTTERYISVNNDLPTTTDESPMIDNNLPIANNNGQYQSSTKDVIDTTVGTTTTSVNIDIGSTDKTITDTFTEPASPQHLTEVANIENSNIAEGFVTTDKLQGVGLITDTTSGVIVTVQYETTPNVLSADIASDVSNIYSDTTLFDNTPTTKSIFFDNSLVQHNDKNTIDINTTTTATTTFDTKNTRYVTQQHNTTGNISKATTTNNNNEGVVVTTFTTVSTIPLISTTESTLISSSTVQNNNQNTTDMSISTIAGTTYDTTNTNSIAQVQNTTESISQATTTNANNEGIVFTITPTTESTMSLISTTDSYLISNGTVQNTTDMNIATISPIYDTTDTNSITQEHNTTESISQATATYTNNEKIVVTTITADSTMPLISTTESTVIDDSTVQNNNQNTTDRSITTIAGITYDTTNTNSITHVHNTTENIISQATTTIENNEGIVFTITPTIKSLVSLISTTDSTFIGDSTVQNNNENTIDMNKTTIAEISHDTANTNSITQEYNTTNSISQATTTNNNSEGVVITTITTDSTRPSIFTTESTFFGNSTVQNNSQNTIDTIKTTIAIIPYINTTESISQAATINDNNNGVVLTTITTDSPFTAGINYDTTYKNSIVQENNTTVTISQATSINNENNKEGGVFTTTSTIETTMSPIFTSETDNKVNQETSGTTPLEIITASNTFDDRITLVSVTEPVTISQFIMNNENTKNEIQNTFTDTEASTINLADANIYSLTTALTPNLMHGIPTERILSNDLVTAGKTNINDLTIAEVNTEAKSVFDISESGGRTQEESAKQSSIILEGDVILLPPTELNVNEYGFRQGISFEKTAPTTSTPPDGEIIYTVKEATIVESTTDIKTQGTTDTTENLSKLISDSIADIKNPTLLTESYKMFDTSSTTSSSSNNLEMNADMNNQDQTLITTLTNIPNTIQQKNTNTIESNQEGYTNLAKLDVLEGAIDNTYISTSAINDLYVPYVADKITKEMGFGQSQIDDVTQEANQVWTNSADTMNQIKYDPITTVKSQVVTKETTETSQFALPLHTDNVVITTTEPSPIKPVLEPSVDNVNLNIELKRTGNQTLPPPVIEPTSILIDFKDNYDELKNIKSSLPNEVFTDTLDSNKVTSNHATSQNKPTTSGSAQFTNDYKNELGNKYQQRTNYKVDEGISNNSDIKLDHDNRDVINQFETDSWYNVLTITESTVYSENVSRLNKNMTVTEKTNATLEELIFGAIKKEKDNLTALSIDENLTNADNIQTYTTGNLIIDKTTDTIGNISDTMKVDVANNNGNISDKISSISDLSTQNEQIVAHVYKISTNSLNESLRNEFDLSVNQVANENNQNINNISHLAGRMQDGLSHDLSQYNASQHEAVVTENEQGGLKTKINTSYIITDTSENSITKQSMASDHNIESSINTGTIRETGFSDDRITSAKRDEPLNHINVLDEKFTQNGAASTTNTIYKTEVSSYQTNAMSISNDSSLTTTHVSLVESQATSMPNDYSLKQPLIVDQKQSQNAAVVTNTENVRKSTSSSVTPNDSSIKHILNNDEKLVQKIESNFGISDNKPRDKTSLTLDSLSAIPKDNMRNKLHVTDEQKALVSHSGTTAVQTDNVVTTAISTESPVTSNIVTSTQSLNSDSTNGLLNVQNLANTFCFTRNRGRYANPEDCTKFYVCIGKTEPIAGKCPENTVFSEIKKQCTKNKSHCVRGNEFQCLFEGRFSDILKNNAYYICIKRHNSFIRFKFQCQNGFYLNKITVRCTKESETINPTSTSVDNSNSEKSASEGVSSKETKKAKNNKNSKKESKSSEEFECQREGKFADRDNCRKYYVCTKTKKSEFRMRRKSCDSDEVFHKDKKKCVEADSYEC